MCRPQCPFHPSARRDGGVYLVQSLLGVNAGLPSLKPLPAYPIINYSVANYRPNLCYFWRNVTFVILTLSLYGTVRSEISFRIVSFTASFNEFIKNFSPGLLLLTKYKCDFF